MEILIKNKFCKGSASKIRPLLYLAKGKNAEEAEKIYRFTKSHGIEIYKMMKNGISIAKERDIEPDKLFIKSISCEKSKSLKRHRYESKGAVARITKRQHHLILILSDQAPKNVKAKKNNKESKSKNLKKDK